MRIICLGAGAIGGYFGGRLIEGGQPVTFLVRERRKRQLLSDGLSIKSQYGDFSSPVDAIVPDEIDGPADIVFLTCKAYDLEPAMEIIRPAIGPDTAILPLLNGIAHMEILNERFGKDRVLGGLAKIAATMNPSGQIVHLNDWRFIKFGEQDGSDTDRVRALKAAFDRTSVIATATPDIMHEMWSKVVHLSTVAGMTTLMRASVGEIASTPGGTALFLDLLEKNAEIARREGFSCSIPLGRIASFYDKAPCSRNPSRPHRPAETRRRALRAVIEMIEAGKPCLEIAQQLQAVEKAVVNAKRALIHDHMDHCLDAEHSPADRAELKAIARYL
jgi:2-dehydropantoate 2-reductase